MNNLPFDPLVPFKFFVQAALPTVMDDSLSYYEVLSKVRDKLNEVIDKSNALGDNVRDFENNLSTEFDDFIHCLVSDYNPSNEYVAGDYCYYNDNIYKCIETTTGTFDISKWGGNPVVFADSVTHDIIQWKAQTDGILETYGLLINTIMNHIAAPYSTALSYEVGDYVNHNGGIIYKCVEDTTEPAGTFDSTKWESIVVVNELKSYYEGLWGQFLEEYRGEIGLVVGLGDSEIAAMTQDSSTTEFLKSVRNLNVLTSPLNLNEITGNAIYLLDSNYTYTNAPYSNAIGFLMCLETGNIKQQIFVSYASSLANGAGKVYYRNYLLTDGWRSWWKININQNEITSALGSSTSLVMNQKGVTDNFALGMQLKGILPSGSFNLEDNSIYVIDSSLSYTDAPETTPQGFLFTTTRQTLTQQLYIKLASTQGGGSGYMYYRNRVGTSWRVWHRINITANEKSTMLSTLNTDINKKLNIMNYDGDATTPTSLFASRTPYHYTAYASPSWVTEIINNIAQAFSVINFGSLSATNAAAIGVEKSTLKSFVYSPNTNSGDSAYANGVEKSATIKLTSFNKKLYMFGDSITWGSNGDDTGQRVSYTFAATIQRNLGISCVNWGKSSQGYLHVSDGDGRTALQEIGAHSIGDGDYYTLAWGVNDWSLIQTGGTLDTTKLGTYTDTTGDSLMAQVYQCVNKLYTDKPKCQVILIKPWNGRNIGTFPKYKFGNTTYAALIEEIKKFAEYYDVAFIGDDCPLAGWGIKSGSLMGADGVHPSVTGYKFIGNWLSGQLAKIIG